MMIKGLISRFDPVAAFVVQDVYQYSFKKAFMSDPSTYPLIVVMGVATSFVVGMSLNGLRYKNVKISPSLKHETIPAYTPPRDSVTKVITRQPMAFHSKSFKDIRQEGMGVDHEEWRKEKESYYST